MGCRVLTGLNSLVRTPKCSPLWAVGQADSRPLLGESPQQVILLVLHIDDNQTHQTDMGAKSSRDIARSLTDAQVEPPAIRSCVFYILNTGSENQSLRVRITA